MFQIPDAVIDSIELLQLQAPPQILLRFLRLVEDDRTTMSDLAALVGRDPSLSARILSVANSPALQRCAATKNLTQCLVNLGTRLSRTLAACLVVQNVFSSAVNNRAYDLSGFWGHSLLIAELARDISTAAAYPDVDEAYLSGLLHDIGQLLLLGGMEECYGGLLESSVDEEELLKLEEMALGTNHTAVGAWLTDQWKLSSFMADSILFHHKTAAEIASADRLSQIVWAAHVLCERIILPEHAQKTAPADLAAVTALLGIDADSADAIQRNCSERVAVVAEALEIGEAAARKVFPYKSAPSYENPLLKPGAGDRIDSRLTEAVCDMAMLQTLQHGLNSLAGEAEILLGIREAARILFGAGRLAFLLVRPDKAVLSGAAVPGQPEVLQRLEIPLAAGESLAADAILAQQPRSTFDAEYSAAASLADVQLARSLGSQGVLYLALPGRTANIGVIAFGVSSTQHHRLRRQLTGLTNFARLAADSVETWRDMQERERSAEAVLTKRFEQHGRKVVHEAGNPLAIINNYLSILRKKMPDTNNLQQELDILREEIDRVSQIVRQMNSLPELPASATALDINALIESMLVLYGKSLFTSRGISVEKSLEPLLTPAACNRDCLKQVLVNLWNNAADAMQGGGIFTISTQADVNQDGRAYIEVRIGDTGPGMPPDVMERLFQPLDPNRRPGHSGVGLSIVAGLVEQLDGIITCRSKAGQGTSFSILLPQTTGTGQ